MNFNTNPRLDEIVFHLLSAFDRPMRIPEIEHWLFVIGHQNYDTFDVRDSVSQLYEKQILKRDIFSYYINPERSK